MLPGRAAATAEALAEIESRNFASSLLESRVAPEHIRRLAIVVFWQAGHRHSGMIRFLPMLGIADSAEKVCLPRAPFSSLNWTHRDEPPRTTC